MKKRKADAILTGDWHLREDQPACRVDDFEQTLWKKVQFVSQLQQQHDCPVLHSGDLFDKWKISPYLIAKAIQNLPAQFYTVYGNHDLPQHSIELKEKSGLYAVATGKGLKTLKNGHWDTLDNIEEPSMVIKGRKILVCHVFIYNKKKEPWTTEDQYAGKLFKRFKGYDLILTGDNHTPFVLKTKSGRLLVNPGSLSRQSAAQIDFRPRVYLYYADTNTVEPVYIPIDADAVSEEHLKTQQLKDARINRFVESLNVEWSTGSTFEENLKQIIAHNKIEKEVVSIINKAID